uniref:Uncharacterized protein n=1 Tax=Meloidogyne incognita TaxID=6306 RepID=A0A914NBT4_MELIC
MQHRGQLVFARVNHSQFNFEQVFPYFIAKLNVILNFYYNLLHKKRETIQKTKKDMFIIWHLFGVARNLIRSFFLDYSQNKAMYDGIFSQHLKLISVISYIRAYDNLEVKANNWMRFLRREGALHGENVEFSHIGVSYTRPQMLMSLQEAEQQGGNTIILYPVQYNHDINTDIFLSTNFLIDLGHIHNPKLKNDECTLIDIVIGELRQNMEGANQENIGFYYLYDNPYVAASKRKIDILIGENLNELFFGNIEYLPENSVNLPNRFNFVTKYQGWALEFVGPMIF